MKIFFARRSVNFKVFKFKKFKMTAISSFLMLRGNCKYIKRADPHKPRNSLVKIKYQKEISLRRYVNFKVFKLKIQNRRHTTSVEFDKESFGENRIFIPK